MVVPFNNHVLLCFHRVNRKTDDPTLEKMIREHCKNFLNFFIPHLTIIKKHSLLLLTNCFEGFEFKQIRGGRGVARPI